jgi:hypothetical protein
MVDGAWKECSLGWRLLQIRWNLMQPLPTQNSGRQTVTLELLYAEFFLLVCLPVVIAADV